MILVLCRNSENNNFNMAEWKRDVGEEININNIDLINLKKISFRQY